ncbi:MAG TPA: rRNA maturation RNase YbeY [Candidatus Merdicola faecigallinarum]|uniref:Endoribonuclease YbeY n=1 Tax=Candidatus Merdicola faecigallinarum TaxID=2840862 RepID=A0A9D1M2E8_9FIRM|nr:rRNA maturation RNase YbeY [Candidatus Merdicola faecigallinarum]
MELVEIEYIGEEKKIEYEYQIQKVIKQCFMTENLMDKNLYINIILTTPEEIRKYNKQYRNIDKETDVLSFPIFEKEEIEKIQKNGNEVPEVLGDLIISMKQVARQAEEYGHSFERELAYMVVHGFYHLMGYDHIEEEDKKEMRLKEENILTILKINRE